MGVSNSSSWQQRPPGDGRGRLHVWMLCLLVPLGAVIAVAGVTWGLPTRASDPFLFGDRTPWTGQEIVALAGGWEPDARRGADVDADAIKDRRRSIVLNATDAQRAAIVRCYRLYSYQPDEMVTFRALASMRPGEGKLDPRLYQYGGLWVYPVGAAVKAASLAGLVTVRSDVAHYLDHPEQFGRFYVVARLYTAFWAVVGVVLVFELAWRLSGGCPVSAALTTLCYILAPIVVNAAHEAKPHLPGAVLMLAAILTAMRYVDTGRLRWWFASSILCGAAVGMVLTAWPVLAVPPLMAWLRWNSWRSALVLKVGGLAIAVCVFLVANPYVGINLICDREVLQSNLGNTAAMFKLSLSTAGILNAARLVGEGASPVVAVAGCIATIAFLRRYIDARRDAARSASPPVHGACSGVGWLLAVPAVICLVQFTLAAAGQPGEYGRFAILPDLCLAMAAVVGVGHLVRRRGVRGIIALALVFSVAFPGLAYVRAFVRDCGPRTSRLVAARELQRYGQHGGQVLGMLIEPAPYVCPPMNVFTWSIRLLPEGTIVDSSLGCDVLIRAWQTHEFAISSTVSSDHYARYDVPMRLWPWDLTPMCWADKTFELLAPPQRGPQNGVTSSHAD